MRMSSTTLARASSCGSKRRTAGHFPKPPLVFSVWTWALVQGLLGLQRQKLKRVNLRLKRADGLTGRRDERFARRQVDIDVLTEVEQVSSDLDDVLHRVDEVLGLGNLLGRTGTWGRSASFGARGLRLFWRGRRGHWRTHRPSTVLVPNVLPDLLGCSHEEHIKGLVRQEVFGVRKSSRTLIISSIRIAASFVGVREGQVRIRNDLDE